MGIIRMETERVRQVARQLGQASDAISQEMENLNGRVRSMNWQGAGADEFRAEFDALMRQMTSACEQGLLLDQRAEREVEQWLAADGQGAIHFQELKRSLSDLNLIMAGGSGVMLASAQVLGVSTAINEQYLREYQDISWKEKFEAEKKIQEELVATKKQLDGTKSAEELQNEINGIDAQIAELEKKKAEAQEKADAWYNKVLPNWPLEGDSDGVPWRVRTDDFEDEIAGYNRQIQELQAQKQPLQNALNIRQQLDAHLAELQGRQNALNHVIDKGVPANGPTKPEWLHNQLGGCANYVAGKRDVSDFGGGHPGDASAWDNQARAAGYDVGERPAKGAIMVFEGQNDVMKVDKTAGHVAYVESVEKVDGGYNVTVSQANTQYDSKGNLVRGTYINPNTKTVFVKDGANGVSFIYDKP